MASDTGSPSRAPPPMFVPQKSAAAPASVDTEHVELREMIASESSDPSTPVPLKDDVMKLAVHGDDMGLKALLDAGTVSASYRDNHGISPLHWAAINNRYSTVKLLLDEGADPNAHGGDSNATPAMWASQRGHYYVVYQLLRRGADPALTDESGYNLLHLATFDGNVLLLVLLLHHGLPVDSRDPQLHTSLMWAAYKGYPACVDLFLRWGADVRAVDDSGFTALHWALVRGNYGCVAKLLEYGVDRFAANNEGKTPAVVAGELKTEKVWRDALEDSGFDRNAHPLHQPNTLFGFPVQDKEWALKRFFFVWPFVEIPCVVQSLLYLPWFLAIPLAIAVGSALHWVAVKALEWAPPGQKAIHRTPYMAGVFAGSAFWVGLRWAWAILPNTSSAAPFSNFFFFLSFGSCLYYYAICMIYDPGFVPKPSGLNEQKEVIENLLSLWKYDESNFCVECMLRKPLRSKHCRRCNRCVARHDHHCPWVFNCIAVANHRQFFLYILTLEIGIMLLIRLALLHVTLLTPISPAPVCAILSEPFCQPLWQDPFTIYISIWTSMQSLWVTMLLVVQLIQIAKAQTTYENMRSSKYDQNHHRHLQRESKVTTALTTAIATASTSHLGAGIDPSSRGPDPAAAAAAATAPSISSVRMDEGWWGKAKKLLGVDVFWKTAQAGGGAGRRERNPYSVGLIGNCKDFWGGSSPPWKPPMEGRLAVEGLLGGGLVDWAGIYETPRLMRMGRSSGGGHRAAIDAGEEV